MSYVTQLVGNRLATAASVQSSAEVHLDDICEAVAAELSGVTPKEVRKVFAAFADHLASRNDALREAEHTHNAELADDPEARDTRDTHAGALGERVALVREVVRANLGAPAVHRYGLGGTLPPSPDKLHQVAANAVSLLRKYPATASPLPGVSVDTDALADDLEPLVEALAASLAAVGIEEREATVTKAARDAALEQWTVSYVGVAALLDGLYRFARRADLAARIRPTQHRASGRDTSSEEIVDEDEPSATPEPADAPLPEPV